MMGRVVVSGRARVRGIWLPAHDEPSIHPLWLSSREVDPHTSLPVPPPPFLSFSLPLFLWFEHNKGIAMEFLGRWPDLWHGARPTMIW